MTVCGRLAAGCSLTQHGCQQLVGWRRRACRAGPLHAGIPADFLGAYPALAAFRSRVASLPKVRARYEQETEPALACYKPDE
jgi:hypothetical protein